MRGVIIKGIGSRLYEIQFAGESYRRHVNQILRNRTPSATKNKDDYFEYDHSNTDNNDNDGDNIQRPSFLSGGEFKRNIINVPRNR